MNYAGGARLEGGGYWIVGEWRGRAVHWLTNPRLLLPRAWFLAIGIWRHSQGGMGRGWLPEAGGLNDQPAWLVEAFGILAAEDARIDQRMKERGG